MATVKLVIGSKNLSSWSLRPWLLLRHHGIAFEEVLIELDRPDMRERILQHSPSGRVPALLYEGATVWDSLAICEQAAEWFDLPDAWPAPREARATARSIAAEMHSGFMALRSELPLDCRRQPAAKAISAAAADDITRIRAIWREARTQCGGDGPWLFGRFGIVDAMYAPVALRFHSYAVALDGAEATYAGTVLAHPAVIEWVAAA